MQYCDNARTTQFRDVENSSNGNNNNCSPIILPLIIVVIFSVGMRSEHFTRDGVRRPVGSMFNFSRRLCRVQVNGAFELIFKLHIIQRS